jgi:Uncharacterized protein family UPF0029/RWD domain
MNEELENEIQAINSIYGDDTLTLTTESEINVLHLPQQKVSLRLSFPPNYPDAPPSVLGSETSGGHKGDATRIVDLVRQTLAEVYRPGEVCLFDVLEELSGHTSFGQGDEHEDIDESVNDHSDDDQNHFDAADPASLGDGPPWALSETIEEKKSKFVARCAAVDSPDTAKQYLNHLVSTNKKVAKATHNITAWRIKGENGVTYRDCDDDGEDAAGGRVLHLMELMDLWNVMIVVTRWYGGVKLGADR